MQQGPCRKQHIAAYQLIETYPMRGDRLAYFSLSVLIAWLIVSMVGLVVWLN
jgi:hypothetical protein